MATLKSWSESDQKSMVNNKDEIIWRWETITAIWEGIKTTILEIEPAEVKKKN